jgi:hypothetical protein
MVLNIASVLLPFSRRQFLQRGSLIARGLLQVVDGCRMAAMTHITPFLIVKWLSLGSARGPLPLSRAPFLHGVECWLLFLVVVVKWGLIAIAWEAAVMTVAVLLAVLVARFGLGGLIIIIIIIAIIIAALVDLGERSSSRSARVSFSLRCIL